MVPLDDIISEELRSDIDESIWRQNTIDGKVYTLPFHQLQNTLMVNREMMEAADLEAYIPEDGAVACWSTEEFRLICRELAKSLTDENTFAFMMYAANNQGDSHIMTLLRAYGCPLYDKDGNFTVNTPEGIRALEWIREMDEQGIIPRGAENLELNRNEAPTGEEMEPDAGEMDLMEQKRFLMSVVEAEGEIQREDPYFDMEQEIRRNPMFALMIANGYDPRRVYEFFYPIRARGNLKKAVEREVMDRIRLRNRRPLTMASPNAAMNVRDVSRMSDEEIGRIDARVKRGERVRL